MKNSLIAITINLSLALAPASSQQQPALQPAPATKPVCAPASLPAAPKGFHFKIPARMQQAIDKQRQQLENKAGVSTPSTDELKKQAAQPKPCPAVQPTPAPKPQQ